MAEDKKPEPKKEAPKDKPKAAEGSKSDKKPKKPYQVWKLYEVKGDQLIRKNKFSPKAGSGYFMANHADRETCGKTYYMEKRDAPAKDTSKPEDKKE